MLDLIDASRAGILCQVNNSFATVGLSDLAAGLCDE